MRREHASLVAATKEGATSGLSAGGREGEGVPGVNRLDTHGRWAFAEFTDAYLVESDFQAKVESQFNKMIDAVAPTGGLAAARTEQ